MATREKRTKDAKKTKPTPFLFFLIRLTELGHNGPLIELRGIFTNV